MEMWKIYMNMKFSIADQSSQFIVDPLRDSLIAIKAASTIRLLLFRKSTNDDQARARSAMACRHTECRKLLADFHMTAINIYVYLRVIGDCSLDSWAQKHQSKNKVIVEKIAV